MQVDQTWGLRSKADATTHQGERRRDVGCVKRELQPVYWGVVSEIDRD